MFTFVISFNLLNHFGTKLDIHYDSVDEEKLTDLSLQLGGKGSSHHIKGKEH